MARWRAVALVGLLILAIVLPSRAHAEPAISRFRILTPQPVPRFSPYEIAFFVSTVATNPYLPFDAAPPQGVPSGQGISVDMHILPPGQTDWAQALALPCFWYQTMVEMGEGSGVSLVPTGSGEWRARFAPTEVGQYTYRLHVQDASGETWSEERTFDAVMSDLQGYCRIGEEDARFFELYDGTPIVAPLVNLEQGQPLNTLAGIRQNIPLLAEHGLRFVRWFPTGEGANYAVAPYGDDMTIAWLFGEDAYITAEGADYARGKLFSLQPYYYTLQSVPAIPGARYRLSFYAKVEGDQVLRAEMDEMATFDIGSSSSRLHEANGQSCDYRRDGWYSYVLQGVAGDDGITVALRGLYAGANAPSPYNGVRPGAIRVHSVVLQRDESGLGAWGPNLLSRGDPDTHTYVDQRSAALLDEILNLSAELGVYHKLPLFHKNDAVLNRLEPNGTATQDWDEINARFYSQDGEAARWYEMAYVRYFCGRWSYSTALHSLELANENHLTPESYDAGWNLAEYVRRTSPRHILMSNSFWGWFVNEFFQDSTRGPWLDYADQHWYASQENTTPGLISNTWDDSAAYAREAWTSFGQTGYGWGPIVRGEGGVAYEGTHPQHPDIAREPEGVYYHKKVWAHVGSLGWSLDGEWYPRLFDESTSASFPNDERTTWDIYAAYDRFARDEPLNNGQYVCVGTDQWGDRLITADASQGEVRAWGVRDAMSGRLLLWIDNAQHTWGRVHRGETITPVSANLVIQGMPAGSYAVTWWDTVAGEPLDTVQHVVGDDRRLVLGVADLSEDLAVKAVRIGGAVSVPLKQPISLGQGWNLVSLAGVPRDDAISSILAPVSNWCNVAWTHDASQPAAPWQSYAPAAPPYANRLQRLDETQGLWVHMQSPATLLVVGMSCDTDIALQAGWNLVGYPRLVSARVQDATGSIADELLQVFAWDTHAGGAWQCWDFEGSADCTLTYLEPGRGYWFEVNSACTWDIP